MARKQRYWVCDKDLLIWTRRKTEAPRNCPRCHETMRAARVYPVAIARKQQRMQGQKKADAARLLKRHSVNRTCTGHRLQVSPGTRKLFRALAEARQRRTFAPRATAVMASLWADAWRCPHGPYMPGTCACSGGGLVSAPPVVVVDSIGYGTLGLYHRSMFGDSPRYAIKICWHPEDATDGDRIDTFIHEAVHALDDLSRVRRIRGCGPHTPAFYARVRDLAQLLHWTAA